VKLKQTRERRNRNQDHKKTVGKILSIREYNRAKWPKEGSDLGTKGGNLQKESKPKRGGELQTNPTTLQRGKWEIVSAVKSKKKKKLAPCMGERYGELERETLYWRGEKKKPLAKSGLTAGQRSSAAV